MKELQAILFPHSYLGEQDIKKIFPLLGPISIFQPWFMTPPDFMSQKDYQGVVKILNPPSHMKPEEDFKAFHPSGPWRFEPINSKRTKFIEDHVSNVVVNIKKLVGHINERIK